MRQTFLENIGRIFLPVAAVAAIAVSLADLFGLLGQLDWLSKRIPTIALLLLASAIVYWIAEQKQGQEQMDKIKEMVSSGFSAEAWSTTEEALTYLARRFGEAQHSIDQAAIAPSLSPATEYTKYDQALTKVLKKGIVKYRHVTLLDTTRWKRVKFFINTPDIRKYFVSYYDSPNSTLPNISFAVIDEMEVVMRQPYGPDQSELWVSIKHIPTARLFARYFDSLYDRGVRLEKSNSQTISDLDKRYSG